MASIEEFEDRVIIGGVVLKKRKAYETTAAVVRAEKVRVEAPEHILKDQEHVLKDLELALQQVDDATIYVWALDDEPVGLRISKKTGLDVSVVPETTLKALISYEKERRKGEEEREKASREREEEQEKTSRERLRWAIGLGVTILIAVGGWVVAIVNSAGSS